MRGIMCSCVFVRRWIVPSSGLLQLFPHTFFRVQNHHKIFRVPDEMPEDEEDESFMEEGGEDMDEDESLLEEGDEEDITDEASMLEEDEVGEDVFPGENVLSAVQNFFGFSRTTCSFLP